VQNATISSRSQELLPFLSVTYFLYHPSPSTILPSSSLYLAIYFLVYLSIFFFPISCIILIKLLCLENCQFYSCVMLMLTFPYVRTCTWCGNKENGLLLLLISDHVDDEEEGRALTRGLPSTVTQRFIHALRLVWP